MTFVTYAQNFEDVILTRAFRGIENGFYIDVGANDPVVDSVTRAFYVQGWRGLNIEPVTEWYERLVADRPNDVNLHLAAGAEEGVLPLYGIPGTGLSTTVEEIANAHVDLDGREVVVGEARVVPLSEICAEHAPEEIHFLKIDVEGAEEDVLKGCDFVRFRPWILIIESTLPNTQKETRDQWEHLLVEADYIEAHFDGLNRFYVAKEHSDLAACLTLPPNVFDDFVLHTGHYYSSLARQQGEAEIARRDQQIATQAEEAEEHTNATFERFGQLDSAVADIAMRLGNVSGLEEKLVERIRHSEAQASEQHDKLLGRFEEMQERSRLMQQHSDVLQENVEALRLQHQQLSDANQSLQRMLEQNETQTKRALRVSVDAARKAAAAVEAERESEALVAEERQRVVAEQRKVLDLENSLAERDAALHQSAAELQEVQRQASDISKDLHEAQLHIADLNRHSHHWHTVAGAASTELERVYGSLSWRLTLPLRKLNAPFARRSQAAAQPKKRFDAADRTAPKVAAGAGIEPLVGMESEARADVEAGGPGSSSRSAVLQRRLAKAISTGR